MARPIGFFGSGYVAIRVEGKMTTTLWEIAALVYACYLVRVVIDLFVGGPLDQSGGGK